MDPTARLGGNLALARLSTPSPSAATLRKNWQAVSPRKAKGVPGRKVDFFNLSVAWIFSARRQFYAGTQPACKIQMIWFEQKKQFVKPFCHAFRIHSSHANNSGDFQIIKNFTEP